jgi:iron complex transport system ATP-binding protein
VTELQAHNISVSLRGRQVLRQVSFAFEPGEMAAIIGPNGAGKTTLLRALAGLQHVRSGRVTLTGKELSTIPRRSLARQLSLVPQNTLFPFAFSVREVVATGRNPYLGRFQREGESDRIAIDEALSLTDTAHLADRPVTELSGGERQRVLIARSLATQARIILLDEPTASLDPAHAIDVLDLCRTLAAGDKVVILTTQDLPMAARHADRIILMNSGAIVVSGTRDQVFTEAAVLSVFGVSATRAFTASGDETLVLHRGDRERSMSSAHNVDRGIRR